ncbi:MAG: CoA transferase [Crocinitomicaceae bacterium]|nr:CoA transferase [Crocinitomicaceae bacterium]
MRHTSPGNWTMINALKDLTVIDASTVLAGPSVGTYLAELGADVIKIEHPTHKDVTRNWKLPSEDKNSSISAYFSSINYLKSYESVDFRDKDDLNHFLELIASADILITNFKKGDDRKFGITEDVIRQCNPRLIHGKINGYGNESDRVAYDLILQAESGFMSMNGTPESGPVKMPVALIDVLSAHHLKEAILLALYQREKSGKGAHFSVSLYDAAVSSLVNQASNYLMGGKIPQRIGSLHPNIAPYGELFQTKDGDTITLAIGSDIHFQKLCDVLDYSDLISDDRFIDNQSRVVNRTELYTLLHSGIKKRNSKEILSALHAKNIPAGKVKNLSDVFMEQSAQSLIREEIIDGVKTKRITSVIFK